MKNEEFIYNSSLNKNEREMIDILRELCPDFAPYNYLKKYDLYKGSLFGGTNVYYKYGINGDKGMVTTKTNIKKYNLEQFQYNFQTESNYNGKQEYGWSGETLLNLLTHLQKYKDTI